MTRSDGRERTPFMARGEEEDFSPEFLPASPVCGERIEVKGKPVAPS
jgi:hypothetical protein